MSVRIEDNRPRPAEAAFQEDLADRVAVMASRACESLYDEVAVCSRTAPGQTTATATPLACVARASMSTRSPVTTVPPGSAIATTRASTAEPARARRRSSAARRAVDSLTDGSMMHIFKNRWVLASRRGSPYRDSTRTIVGTTGGHSSCALNARMSDRAVLVRAERRNTPPLSRTSTDQPTRSSDRSRIRRAIASAVVCWRWLGSPTSAASSSRYRSASASASWRSSSARSAIWSSSEAGRSRCFSCSWRSSGRYTCTRGIRLTIHTSSEARVAHINEATEATKPSSHLRAAILNDDAGDGTMEARAPSSPSKLHGTFSSCGTASPLSTAAGTGAHINSATGRAKPLLKGADALAQVPENVQIRPALQHGGWCSPDDWR
jgi:hypothetical protein